MRLEISRDNRGMLTLFVRTHVPNNEGNTKKDDADNKFSSWALKSSSAPFRLIQPAEMQVAGMAPMRKGREIDQLIV